MWASQRKLRSIIIVAYETDLGSLLYENFREVANLRRPERWVLNKDVSECVYHPKQSTYEDSPL